MSREAPGLGLSSQFQARYDSISEGTDKQPLWTRPVRMRSKLAGLLLVGVSVATWYAAEKMQPARTDLQGAFSSPHAWQFGALLSCLIAAALYGLGRNKGAAEERPRNERNGLHLVTPTFNVPWAQDDPRKHLSRELHDSVGPILTGIGLQLQALRRTQLPPNELRGELEEVSRLNAEALRLVRDLAMGLRPSLIDDVNLGAALEWRARQFRRQTGILTVVDCAGDFPELTEEQRICIYRCVQEALTNCAKHASAKNVRIEVRASADEVRVRIEDDGVGFDHTRGFGSGLGLVGMRERASIIDGKVSIARGKMGGASVTLEIPIGGSVLA